MFNWNYVSREVTSPNLVSRPSFQCKGKAILLNMLFERGWFSHPDKYSWGISYEYLSRHTEPT